MNKYLSEYEAFIASFNKQEISGLDVGEVIMRQAMYFSQQNLSVARALRDYVAVSKAIHNQVDPATGKGITGAKADALTEATEESLRYVEAKIHLSNIQEIINSLKSLQKGVIVEYSNSNL